MILDIDDLDHSRLPAYVVLTANPTEATEGIAIHLDEVESEEEAWWILQTAIAELRRSIDTVDDESDFAERMRDQILTAERSLAITSSAITVIQFGMGTVG